VSGAPRRLGGLGIGASPSSSARPSRLLLIDSAALDVVVNDAGYANLNSIENIVEDDGSKQTCGT
jgi:hypothetical protein